jgi:hypothetical protein
MSDSDVLFAIGSCPAGMIQPRFLRTSNGKCSRLSRLSPFLPLERRGKYIYGTHSEQKGFTLWSPGINYNLRFCAENWTTCHICNINFAATCISQIFMVTTFVRYSFGLQQLELATIFSNYNFGIVVQFQHQVHFDHSTCFREVGCNLSRS